MKKFFLTISVIVFSAVSITASPAENINLSNSSNLKGEWQVVAGPIAEKKIQVPFQRRDFTGELRILKKFSLNVEKDEQEDLVLLLGQVDDSDVTFFNGEKLGATEGSWADGNYSSRYFEDRYYRIPRAKVNFSGINTVEVAVTNYNGFGGITGSDIGIVSSSYFFSDILMKLKKQPKNSDTLYIILMGLFLGLALMNLLNFLYFKEDRADLYLFLILCFFGIFTYAGIISNAKYDVNYSRIVKLNPISLILSIIFVGLFLKEFFQVKLKPVPKWILRIIISFNSVLVLLVIAVPLPYVEQIMTFFVQIVSLELLFYIALSFMGRHGDIETYAVSIGMVFWAMTALYDVFYYFKLVDLVGGALSVYGYFLFLTMITVFKAHSTLIMRLQLRKANVELSDLNANLEKKVDERTIQLSEAKDEIEAAMEELSATNDNLITVNSELESAQRIMKKDMQMAVNVQRSFFPKKAPVTPDWDIAYICTPMSGISGDLYDFYEIDGRFAGAAMFDVSGHGIASGLVTMLAKSIIFRNFHAHSDAKLGTIMENINTALIAEKGDVDNYMTGILLRMNVDGVVEYVNAGHTELIYRSASKASASIVNIKDGDFKGHFSGIIEGMTYQTLKFKSKPGDVIVMYSDCLIESTNAENEQYDIQRVMKTLSNAPQTSAHEILTYITDRFYDFTGKRELRDDLTVIVLKRM